MIQDDNPVYLDLNELEEIIIYYFHDANYELAERQLILQIKFFQKSINISILSSEILLQKSKNLSCELIDDCLGT